MRQFSFILFLFLFSIPILVYGQNDPTIYGGLEIEHVFDTEGLVINTLYRTDYGNGTWRITDNKNMYITLDIIDQLENTTVLVEHVHIDCNVFSSTSEYINGLQQDSMDDKLHTGLQPGFYVDEYYNYTTIFAIEGYSEMLISGWSYYTSYYGTGYITEDRLSESNLRAQGAEGSEISVVFDILVKNNTEEYFHTFSFMDTFVVYFDGGFQQNIGGELEEQGPDIYNNETVTFFIIVTVVAIIAAVYYVLKG